MFDFEPILTIWKNYAGTGSLLVLYVLGLFCIWRREERKDIRALLVWGSLLTAGLFSCPLFRQLFVRLLDSETYYRILWILPIGIVIAYAGILINSEPTTQAEAMAPDFSESTSSAPASPSQRLETHHAVSRPLSVLILCFTIMISGSLVYKSQYITPAENVYKLPQVVIDICEEILPEEVTPDTRIVAVFPSELIHFVRQYSSDIRMPYGREMLVERWNNERELFDLMEAETYDVEWIADKAIQNYCRYVILNANKEKTEPMENYEYVLDKIIGPYEIYRDTRF